MADRKLNIQVAFSALNNMSQPVNAARQSAAALASQIKQTQSSIKGLERQATSFDRLTAANKKTTDQLAQAKTQAREMAAAFGPLRQRSAEQVTALNQQRAAIRNLTAQQKTEQAQLNQLRASFYSEGIAIGSTSRATEQISQRTAQYNRQLTEQQRRLESVTQAQARYARAKETGEKLQSSGMKTAATGAAVLAPVAAAIKSYSSLEDAMKGVSKQVNGLRDDDGNRTAQFAEMQNAIKDAAENLPMPNGAVDYAALVEGGARMGVANSDDPWQKQKKDLLDFANTAAMASKAFELPADQLSESLGKIAGLYKIPIQDIGKLGDVINYLDDNAKSKGSDIIDVLQRVGGAADQLGYQNAAALGSTFLSLGEQSETAGTAVKAMVRELGNAMVQPDRFMEGLDALGLSAEKVQKNMAKDAMGTIMAVMEATKKLEPDKQMNVLTQLFGDEYAMAVSKVANNLPELRRQLELTHGTASKGSMKRESDIDKDSLSSQWQITKAGFINNFSALGESLRGTMMKIMTSASNVMKTFRGWVEANPQLVASIMKIIAVLGAAMVAMGGIAMVVGTVLAPLALIRLGFSSLSKDGSGLSGILLKLGGALKIFMGALATGPMAALQKAFQFLAGSGGEQAAEGAGGVMEKLAGAATDATKQVYGLATELNILPEPADLAKTALTTLATGGIGGLKTSLLSLAGSTKTAFLPLITVLGGISAPVWGLIALFAGVAIAIIQFWQPIKAFFSGFFTGLMQGLQPIFSIVSAVFSPLVPIFDAIISAISTVWDWFTKLFEPIQFSTEALKSCTSAGESFGKIVGDAISLVLWLVEQLWKGLDLVLEKLGLIPDQAERAKKAVEQVNTQKKLTGLADTLAGDLKAVTAQSKKEEEKKEQKRKTEQSQQQQAFANNLKGPANLAPKISGSLDKIASNTAEKKDGPGEIVFKNKQPYIPIRGGYAEPVQQVQRQVPSLTAWMQQQAGALVSSVLPYSVQQPAARSPVSAVPSAASVASLMPGGDVFNFEININDAGQMDEQKLVQRIREEFTVAQQQAARRKRSQLTDHE
ncbi:phage tail tape measure protein [Escherichia coli]|uniref:Phage tail tape measure protein n=3 Tax=Escherichia coli TaxID=562 RepID=A0AB73Q985_ECOLX|nr:phage tail tape measure protein [Escherichia coli]MBL9237233.1 phage tail tape measure protein [Escherichia coli]MBL9237275.1 phage tail tape measure protein [Escherichia coli]OZO75179.1 phage tail tape measure protein [Escherichia coli]OZP04550.1 phage tail tape measure protein [Escherichia coli]OZP19568.1 phage tail tape measure protein [Escherichia coli]